MSELAERCEQATGPDRTIDRDIALLLGLYDRPEDLGCFVDEAMAVVGGGGQTFAPPEFSASIDAAMTLTGEWGVHLRRYPELNLSLAQIYLHEDAEPGDGYVLSRSKFATPALAICAAALRAMTVPGTDTGTGV